MKNPAQRNQLQTELLILAIVLYLFIVLYSFHCGYLCHQGQNPVLALFNALDHMFTHPFEIFPTEWSAVGAGLLLGLLAPMFIYLQYLKQKNRRPAEEHGSAKWNTNTAKFLKEYAGTPLVGPGSKNMILTQELCMSLDAAKSQRNAHVMAFGGSGSYKSWSLMKPNLLQANCSIAATDPSGELLESSGVFLQEEGFDVRVFNLVDLAHSNRYNPFRYIRNQEGVLSMISALIRNTTPPEQHSKDPFWEKAETALLEAVCFYMMAMLPKEEQNFGTVMSLLRMGIAPEGTTSTLEKLFDGLAQRSPKHIAVKTYATYKVTKGSRTEQSILVSVLARLDTFNLDAVDALTGDDDIHLEDIGDRKVALFCVIPETDKSKNFLVALLFSQLFDTLFYHAKYECPNKRLPVHVRFMLDEFAAVGNIADFSDILSNMRKYNMSATLALQGLGQLKKRYKEDWDTLISNCDSLLFLGSNDPSLLKYFSELLGKETILTESSSRNYGGKGGSSKSTNSIGRELAKPEELRTMDNKYCIYLLRGVDPFFSKKYVLQTHPNFPRCGDADPAKKYDVRVQKHTGHSA